MVEVFPYIIIIILLVIIFFKDKKIQTLNEKLYSSKDNTINTELNKKETVTEDSSLECYDEKPFYVDNRRLKRINNAISDNPVKKHKEKTPYLDFRRMGKSDAIDLINTDQARYYLTHKNTCFSNINTALPVWWFDISQRLFKEDLHLILKNEISFYWLRIPRGTFDLPQTKFYIRQDNEKVQLRISTKPGSYFMRDTAPRSKGVGFEQYVIKEFK